MFEILFFYITYSTYQIFNPIMGVNQAAYQPPPMYEQMVVNENGLSVAGAKVTFYTATQQQGGNWFPLQTRKIAEVQSGADGKVKFSHELLYSEPNGYIVYTVQANGYGIAAGAAERLSEPNSRIILSWPSTIAGQVVDEAGKPIAGANVHLAIAAKQLNNEEILAYASLPIFSNVSDGLGRFAFSNVGTNYDVDVIATKDGLLPALSWGHIVYLIRGTYHAGKSDILLAMHAAPAKIKGKTINEDTGKPVGNIWVDLRNSNGMILQNRYSDADGRFSFDLDPCTVEINVHDSTETLCGIDRRNITCVKGQVLTADMHLRGMGNVIWTGTSNDLKDANDFNVCLKYETCCEMRLSLPDVERGMTTRLAHGKYKVLDVVRQGYRKIAGPNEITIQAGRTAYANFMFEKAALTGRVHDKAGSGIGGVELYIVPGSFPVIQSNADGSFSIPTNYIGAGRADANSYWLLPRRLIAAFQTEKNLGAIVPLEEKNGPVDITLLNGATIKGKVIDEANAPVVGADVWLLYDLRNNAFLEMVPRGDFQTDANGMFSFAGVCKGTYRIRTQGRV